jgi:2-amino-4-hydroxy-6-hydroxymethyldihydropteridine diphosphokinase
LGSNQSGAWGSPVATLKRAVIELAKTPGTRLLRQSRLYETDGVGPGRPGVFVNSVVTIETHCGPDTLLRRLKMIEHTAGPRSARRWGPRTLDLDILDYRGRIVGWPGMGRMNDAAIRNRLVLPHPLLHERHFVLVPLIDVAPDWRHPVLHRTARQLWARMRDERKGRVINEV